ncbi:MAG TPA: DUF2282 domain-containing protein [Steroidobacteraceae bacterium]|nr:DUF2282 domain-containing protein [Steroidobacteraceae bacterium]
MSKYASAVSTVSAALGLVLGATAVHAADAMPAKADMAHMEKCYGINRVAKNDCAAGAHSCAGQATRARDPKSFVLLPAGACSKIQGGALKPM